MFHRGGGHGGEFVCALGGSASGFAPGAVKVVAPEFPEAVEIVALRREERHV